ncbi:MULTISPECIES: glycine cleavage system aminomethyltransferase GcvT [unclassified Streptomyces]|uniref:glycine cleavage system aminomethyltransferase GcvT n=1 Tax=unclassified Streptomyces TaxID=2593676 RepID=UPI0022559130|nr:MULTISPECIES: glycine cleavage system aminomethyltransferase GcvT [unclassified Streptomyces]WSU21623.1 glycine cleavage system aminomethyltransferase GcvT [Streptomyces sp. NBC_01108]MCX4789516.1 glycine cleavage system aminomethyltransferase GcvT [Streptomyces sp. NBC_01221]MCX4794763.1 glycine cleavage system aminomethyltransferase GcvT [Streptomyces sp. NBC_01242]WSJ36083.1 glycine cleavage system aminomethyltransferase GcvT [Streptomyces sp. NBC_01321]WSP62537.1 glycine cleavage system
MSTAPRLTALDALHRSLGATMTDFAGWDMPLRYGSERDEHNAVRTRAGLFDLSHMGEITVTGPEAAAFLNFALVGNIATVAVGRARYTMICAEDGGILDDLIVYRLGETETPEYLVVANAGNAQIVLDALTARAGGFDTEVRDDRDAYALLAVQGPESAAILAAVTDADLDGLKYYAGLPGTVAGVPALIARTGYTGEDGFELFVAPEHAEQLWKALTEAGASRGLIPCGLSCRDTLRLEAGMPLYGHELNTGLTPFDAGLGRVVKFEKEGDFVGREALRAAAERAETAPPRKLVGLIAEGRRVPRAGFSVVAGGEVVGEVTSGAPSPTLGKPIAMAYVDAAHATPGTAGVGVDIRGSHEPYEVVALPFYKRQK